MLLGGEHLAQAWGDGWRMLWLALGTLFFFVARAAEMFAETSTRAHEEWCLRRADVAFLRGENQLKGGQWSTADRVDLRFRGNKGDQLRAGDIFKSSEERPATTSGRQRRCRRFNDRAVVVIFVPFTIGPASWVLLW